MNFRSSLPLILFFFFLALSVHFIVNFVPAKESEQKNNHAESKNIHLFKNFYYFVLENKQPKFFVSGPRLEFSQGEGQYYFYRPQGKIIDSEKSKELIFEGTRGEFQHHQKYVKLEEGGKITVEQNVTKADTVEVWGDKQIAKFRENVFSFFVSKQTQDVVKVNSQNAQVDYNTKIATYEGKVKGDITPQNKKQRPVLYQTDLLSLYELDQLITLTGNVRIDQGNIQGTSRNGKILLTDRNKKLKTYELFDDVKLKDEFVDKNNNKIVRYGFGENLEGHMDEKIVILKGGPKVIQDKDVITGQKIIVYEDQDLVEVESNNSQIQIK